MEDNIKEQILTCLDMADEIERCGVIKTGSTLVSGRICDMKCSNSWHICPRLTGFLRRQRLIL